jgi:hypothetical protein
MNPGKFKSEMIAEQNKYAGKCIYHLTKSHSTPDCYIKKECDKLLAAKKTSNPSGTANSGSNQGQLRHITEEQEEEECVEEVADSLPDLSSNNTNEADLYYFAHVSNHYLRLVKSDSPTDMGRHSMEYPIVADSGANFHMFKDLEFFFSMEPANGFVTLGDGQTKLPIQGIGTVQCTLEGQDLIIKDFRFVPNLSESINSLLQHIKQPGHGLYSSYETGLHIKFPNFQSQAIVGKDDIYLDAKPCSTTVSSQGLVHDSIRPEYVDVNICRIIHHDSLEAATAPKHEDNLLRTLRRYYETVKSKRQLCLNTPAGFRQSSQLQQLYTTFTPPRKARQPFDNTGLPDITTNDKPTSASITQDVICQRLSTDDSSTNRSIQAHVPILRCVDKPSSSLPSRLTFSEDLIRASVGFRRIETIKNHLKDLYQPTIKLDNLPPDAVLDPGDVSTMPKVPQNTDPVARPLQFADVMHMDIVFGPEIALGNIHYGLMFTDRFSRMTYIYPLQNLTSDIRKQLDAFFAHLGITPKRFISDFDTKLIGGKARDYLNSLKIHVNAAPANRQDKNGLVERHWQTMVAMGRNWLASAELPAFYWFYAVKRAAEVSNYFPMRTDTGSWTTLLETAHGVKLDLRLLFRLFSVAAVCREHHGDSQLNKFDAQSTPMIAIGRCPNSNALQFFNPRNGTFVSSIDFKFQPNVTSGAFFRLKYQPGTFIYRLDESNSIFAPSFPLETEVYVNTHSPPSKATIIGLPTYTNPEIYTVAFPDGSISEYTSDLLSAIPTSDNAAFFTLLPSWIKGGSNATLFLTTMSKPRHGTLQVDENNIWSFFPGKSEEGFTLPDLEANCHELLRTGQLFRGHAKFRNVYNARNQASLTTCVLRHVSAHGLRSLIAPTSLKSHSTMDPADQLIWNDAYNEEYDGLVSLPTWEIILEEKYRQLSKGKKALPTMAIATIKYDEHNKHKRAKYHLVVLGNLDYHTWSKKDTAAPVLSQLELRLLTSLATYNKRVLKNCDVKQAFIQSSLPEGEEYFLRPPPGCPRSQPGQYWRLLCSLYGLKRAPKLWFQMLFSHLLDMGLKSSSTSPCLFVGSLIPGEPPIYVCIYVDDIIYFSKSDQVESKFEQALSSLGSVDFMGKVSLFLGIEFTWTHHSDGNLSVHLTQQSFAESLLDSLGFDHF